MPRSRPAIGLNSAPGAARERHRADRGEPGRQPEAAGRSRARSAVAGEEAVAVGADRDEEGVPEGELAGHADQQGQADRADRGGHREQPGLQPEAVEEEGRRGAAATADQRTAPDDRRTPARSDTGDLPLPNSPDGPDQQDEQHHHVRARRSPSPRPRNASSSW